MSIVTGNADQPLLDRLMAVTPQDERDELCRYLEAAPTIAREMLGSIAAPVVTTNQKGLKIACFSEQATSLLLWSHYADAHRGFCVEYCPCDLEPNHPHRRLLFPVIYSATRFDAAPFFKRASLNTPFLPTHTFLGAIHKALEWKYEHEWRIVNPLGSDEKGMLVPMVKPRAVHLGVRMAEAHREKLASICSSQCIPTHDVKLSGERYEVLVRESSLGAT